MHDNVADPGKWLQIIARALRELAEPARVHMHGWDREILEIVEATNYMGEENIISESSCSVGAIKRFNLHCPDVRKYG